MFDKEQFDQDLRKITTGAGVVMMIMGALILWKGITTMIPVLGPVDGGMYCVVGALVFVGGILFLVLPGRAERKKRREAEARQDGEEAR